MDEERISTNEEGAMVYQRLGFVPTSVWYFQKSASLSLYVDDEIAQGSYSVESDTKKGRISHFNPLIAEKILKIWSRPGDKILDPFAGRTRALIARILNRSYVGFEISPKICKQLSDRLMQPTLAEFQHAPVIINADCRTMNFNGEFDIVFSCPPYWDVEDYNKLYEENVDGQLSNYHNYENFMHVYGEVIVKLYAALKSGGYAVWVVSDIRRDKTLIPFSSDTINVFRKAGFLVHDIVINKLNTLAVMGVGAMIDNRYCPKAHEYILVFKKP